MPTNETTPEQAEELARKFRRSWKFNEDEQCTFEPTIDTYSSEMLIVAALESLARQVSAATKPDKSLDDLARDQGVKPQHARIEALEFAHGAIGDAIYLDDGLDGDTGQTIQRMIRDALGYDPQPRPREGEPEGHMRFAAWENEHLGKRIEALETEAERGRRTLAALRDIQDAVLDAHGLDPGSCARSSFYCGANAAFVLMERRLKEVLAKHGLAPEDLK
jgi:hypothetical protein